MGHPVDDFKIFFYRIFDSIAFRLCSKNNKWEAANKMRPNLRSLFHLLERQDAILKKMKKNYSTSDVIARKIHAFYIIDVHTHSSSLSKCNWPKKFDSCENSRFVKKNNGNKKWGNQIENWKKCQMTVSDDTSVLIPLIFIDTILKIINSCQF